jgi:hypothetical protein
LDILGEEEGIQRKQREILNDQLKTKSQRKRHSSRAEHQANQKYSLDTNGKIYSAILEELNSSKEQS